MAQVARALWPCGRALAWGLAHRPPPRLPVQGRAGFAGTAGGPAATARKGSSRLLGAAALALGGALGLYHTARWHLRAQDLRAERSAVQVSQGRAECGSERWGLRRTSGLLETGGVRNASSVRCDLEHVTQC